MASFEFSPSKWVPFRDKKVLEKLKEKRESEYYRQGKLEEFKAVDDLNSSQFVRKSQRGGD